MHFNSHPHEEDDDRFRRTVEGTAGISTHILTKRMTESPELHRCRVIFQLTSSRRGWPYQSNRHGEGLVFQLTSSRRGWPRSWQKRDRRLSFQLTSSRRGWQLLPVVRLSKGENFNSHPHEEDDVLVFYKPAILVYFNSHPHEEDDESYRENPVFRVISTHILTKRMTIFKDTGFDSCTFQLTSSRRGWPDIFLSFFFCIIISTHILTKRMTKKDVYVFVRKYISTHILTKRMTKLEARINGSLAISTHILTKRMTLWWLLCSSPFDISTHILTKRTTIFSMASSSALIFQLTSSRRGWPFLLSVIAFLITISTHILTKRMTFHFRVTQWMENISTHILTKRMTLAVFPKCHAWDISTHILTKRMTPPVFLLLSCYKYFNSHPHEEDVVYKNIVGYASSISTHILTKRMTAMKHSLKFWKGYFNSHPHEEDDHDGERKKNMEFLFQLTSSRRGWR